MQSADSDSELEERGLTPPFKGQSKRKRQKQTEKLFICPCGKKYPNQQSLIRHVQGDKRNQGKHIENLQEYKQKIKKTLDQLFEKVENVPQVKAKDVPTCQEEYKHKESSSTAFNLICNLWKTLPPKTYGIVDEVIFDRLKFKAEKSDSPYSSYTQKRKEALNRNVQQLINDYSLQELYRLVGSNNEFKDYRLEDDSFEAIYTLNFAWDLLKYFKPSFAAKIQIILYAICCKDMLNLNDMEGWRSFKAREWSNYAFIEPILEDYRHRFDGGQAKIQYL